MARRKPRTIRATSQAGIPWLSVAASVAGSMTLASVGVGLGMSVKVGVNSTTATVGAGVSATVGGGVHSAV